MRRGVNSIVKTPNEWKFRASKGRWVTITMPSTIRCNNDFALKQFALEGLGLALFPRFFVEKELASGKLVQVFLGFLKERFGAEG